MFVVSIETRKLLPAWFKIRLFSTGDEAYTWFKSVIGEGMFSMGPSEDSKIVTSWSDGETTVNMKKVSLNEDCPEEYREILDSLS